MTERRVVVLAFFAFLAVGAVAILVFASQPVSHPSIQSGRGAATTRPHRCHDEPDDARHPSATPHRGEGRVGHLGHLGHREPGPHHGTTDHGTTDHGTTHRDTTTAAPLTAAPPTAAPPTAAPPTAAPPTAAPPDHGAAPTAAPTTTPPTTAPPTTNKEKPLPPGQAKK